MTDSQSKPGGDESGCSVAVVIVVVLLVLSLPCVAGVLFVARSSIARMPMPQPMPLPPVPGANAPLPANVPIPPGATITVNDLKWSGNLFEAAEESLTQERYDQIKPGMTYEEVLSALAIPEHKRPDDMELVGPESNVELKWFGGPDDATSITVKLKGKTVVDKSQSGLKQEGGSDAPPVADPPVDD